jgi:8-oxo-dGTP pyrophosphatase MutT (NUDIX family)
VLVPLLPGGPTDEPHVLFTRRRSDLRHHAGEVSFPGGRRDPTDATLKDTALREAEEELGLPRGEVSLLGELAPTSTFTTNYLIHPFVGLVAQRRAWRPSALEVDAVLELSVGTLRAGRTRMRLKRRAISFETDAYEVGDQLIWGATSRILDELLGRLEQLMPPSRRAPRRDCPTPSRSRRSS